jgi:hypothetical protein
MWTLTGHHGITKAKAFIAFAFVAALAVTTLLPLLGGVATASPGYTIRSVLEDGNYCLDVHYTGDADLRDGQLVQLWQCHGGPNQQFWMPGDGNIHSALGDGNWCLDVPYSRNGRDPYNGASIQLYRCHGGPSQDFWTEPVTTAPGFAMIHSALEYGTWCLDVAYSVDDQLANGQRIQLWQCASGYPRPADQIFRSDAF